MAEEGWNELDKDVALDGCSVDVYVGGLNRERNDTRYSSDTDGNDLLTRGRNGLGTLYKEPGVSLLFGTHETTPLCGSSDKRVSSVSELIIIEWIVDVAKPLREGKRKKVT